MLQTLRKAGGSLVMTVPKAFIEQNGLTEGSQVVLHLLGKRMTVEAPTRPHYKLADLLAEMPDGRLAPQAPAATARADTLRPGRNAHGAPSSR